MAAGDEAGAPAPVRVSARHFGGDLQLARQAGLDGVEVGVGPAAERLTVADGTFRERIRQEVQATGLVVSSLSMDLLNARPVATDPMGPAWLQQAIEAAGDLGAEAILVPFFGPAELLDGPALRKGVVDALVARMRAAAPRAAEAGVVLALENTCSAEQNLEILDRIGHDAVACYYDIGNSTGAGYDVPAEIRLLGSHLPIIHFKDGEHYLGQGGVRMEPVAEALRAIGYAGWVVLETACPSDDAVADCRRNTEFVRGLMA